MAKGYDFEILFLQYARADVTCLQVYCILLFMYAASLFGTIIAQINEIVVQNTTMTKDLDVVLESYLALKPR